MPITVNSCSIYPVKSLGGIAVNDALVTPRGLTQDRLYKLIDETGKFITQRQHAAMATITTQFTEHGLNLSAPGKIPFNLTPDVITTELVKTIIWDDECEANVANTETNDWFSDFLKTPVRLVRLSDDKKRYTDAKYSQPGDEVSFADGYPILVTTQASLMALQPHFKSAVDMSRFRPNIVLAGNAPFAEDVWHHIKIGGVELELVKPCARCVITTIDQTSGEKLSTEPIATLSKLRRGEKGVYFGMNAIPRKLGVIHVGDTVEILSTQPLHSRLIPTKMNALQPAAA